jgi:hypothetical protein
MNYVVLTLIHAGFDVRGFPSCCLGQLDFWSDKSSLYSGQLSSQTSSVFLPGFQKGRVFSSGK